MAMSEAVDLLASGMRLRPTTHWSRPSPGEPRRSHGGCSPTLPSWTTGTSRTYVEVPYPTLQRHTGGIQRGTSGTWRLGQARARAPTWASIAKHAVLTGNRVLFYSLEMSEAEVRARFHAAMADGAGLRDHRGDLRAHRDWTVALYRKLHR